MLGAVIGDVVGSRFEFNNIKSKKFLMFHPFCHITDDSVMTIAIAKSMCEYFGTFTDESLENLCIKNMQQFGRKIRTSYGSMFYKLDFTLDKIRDTYTYQGDCDGTVPYAIECFLEGETFEDVIRNAISIGGDSDTIAAIAGSIAEPMMPYKYYKIAKRYCRKNLFLRRQFKYLECARIAELLGRDNGNDEECFVDDNSSVKKYFKFVPEFKFVWKFMKKRKFIEWRIMITKLMMVKWNYLL